MTLPGMSFWKNSAFSTVFSCPIHKSFYDRLKDLFS